jgi:hypothetical protein
LKIKLQEPTTYYEQQLSKEQHPDQVAKFVDVQHYDLSRDEPSYQPLHFV